MIGLIALVVSVGLADSVNPTTVGAALYLATTPHARRSLSAFTLGVFATYLIGGVALLLGPGQLLLAALPDLSQELQHIIEIALGAGALVIAVVLWTRRDHIARGIEKTQQKPLRGRSSFALGAGITIFELPTALPYFAVIAALLNADPGLPASIGLLVVFNVAFVAPLLVILIARIVLGERAEQRFARLRPKLLQWGPRLVPALVLVVAVSLCSVGAVGLATEA